MTFYPSNMREIRERELRIPVVEVSVAKIMEILGLHERTDFACIWLAGDRANGVTEEIVRGMPPELRIPSGEFFALEFLNIQNRYKQDYDRLRDSIVLPEERFLEKNRIGRLLLSRRSELDARRVSWLFYNTDSTPIDLCLEEGDNKWCVPDGNHRLVAAWMRKDETISARLTGNVEWSLKVLGV